MAKIFAGFGVFLILAVIVGVVLDFLFWGDAYSIFSYNIIAALVLGYALISSSPILASSVLFTAIPFQVYWLFGVISMILRHGFSAVIGASSIGEIILFFVFLTVIPASAVFCYRNKFSKLSYVVGILLFVIVLPLLTFYFTDYSDNINCIYYPCSLTYSLDYDEITSNIVYGSPGYFYNSMLYSFIFCTISYFGIVGLFYIRTGR